MGLIDVLDRAGGARAHVLVAEAPGGFRARVALERDLARRGWPLAESVADADVLAVVGEPGEDLAAVLDHVWEQMSEPRVRVHARGEAEAGAVLREAHDRLVGGASAPAQAHRSGFTPSAQAMADEHEGGEGNDGGHDHSAMMPDGIALAEGAEDRDGLEMDELHLPLGPVLAHWPAGVVLRVTVHGDVVTDAVVERLGAGPGAQVGPDDSVERAARLLDAAGSVLALAGLPRESARARRLRDRCLDGEPVGPEVTSLGERVRRRAVLRWVLAGLAVRGSRGAAEELGDRLTGLFDRARAELDGAPWTHVPWGLQALPTLVQGMELAAVRLWLAVLKPDLAAHERTAEAADG